MYQQPKLEFYGTLRELTQIGFGGPTDVAFVNGVPSGTGPGGHNLVCTGTSPFIPPNGECHFS